MKYRQLAEIKLNMMKVEAQHGYLGAPPTYPVRREILRELLLMTNGVVKLTIKGVPTTFSLQNKHLGVGVYQIWLDKQS